MGSDSVSVLVRGFTPASGEQARSRGLPASVNGVRVLRFLPRDDDDRISPLVSPITHSLPGLGLDTFVGTVYPALRAVVVANPSIGTGAVSSLAMSLLATSTMLILVGEADIGTVNTSLYAQSVAPTPCFLDDSDCVSWLGAVIRRDGTIDPETRLLHAWHHEIASLPAAPRVVLCSLLAGKTLPLDVRDFIHRCGCTRRTIERSFSTAHLPGVAKTLMAIRLARSWSLMQNNRLSVARSARLVGFGSPKTFARTCANWLGVSPSELKLWTSRRIAGLSLVHLADVARAVDS